MAEQDQNAGGKPDTNMRDRLVNTEEPLDQGAGKRLPHERDQSPEGDSPTQRTRIQQAARDIEQGLVDTDLRETRGVQKAPPGNQTPEADPLPVIKRD